MATKQDDTKNVKLIEELKRDFPVYEPTEKEKELAASVFYKFRNAADHRNQGWDYFDGDDLITYIEDSVRRFNTNVDMREDIEDWQARVHQPMTRNKVMAILGKLVQFLPALEYKARGDEDILRASILTDLYEYSAEIDNDEEKKIYALLETIVKGTVIMYEGYEKRTRTVRDIISDEDGNLKVSEKPIKISRLYSEIVPVEEFYPQSVRVDNISEMTYCFRRQVLEYQRFLDKFAQFSKSKDVTPKLSIASEGDVELPFYNDYISDTVEDGHVEVIYYYNKDTDEYILLANGVWLNPKKIKNDEEVVSPNPFKHKELPFWSMQFEKFGAGFFYGKSLPDKLKSLQDVFNVLSNMLLDQSFLTIFPPMLTAGFDSIEDDYLRPGRRIPVDSQGLKLRDQYEVLNMGTPSGWHQYILEFTKRIMEESSVDQVSQGIAGVGERTTASEIRTAAEGVAATLGIFGRLARTAMKRQGLLRGKNIQQFWTIPTSPIIEGVLGEGGKQKFAKAFNTVSISDTRLSSGDRGKKMIMMFAESKDMPSRGELQAESQTFEILNNEKIELVATPAEYIRNMEFDVKLTANPKLESSKEADRALELEKARVYMSFFPDLVDKKEIAARIAEVFGDDPTKIFTEQTLASVIAQGADQKMVDQGAQTLPQGNQAQNTVQGINLSQTGGGNPFLQ